MTAKKKCVRDMTPDELAVHKAELLARQEAEDAARRAHVIPMDARLWNIMDVCAYLDLRKETVYAKTSRGEFPAPLKLGRCNKWKREDIIRWAAARKEDWVDPITFRADRIACEDRTTCRFCG